MEQGKKGEQVGFSLRLFQFDSDMTLSSSRSLLSGHGIQLFRSIQLYSGFQGTWVL